MPINDLTQTGASAGRAGFLLIVATSICILIFGWGLGSETAIRIRPEFAAMVPSTAILFLLLSAALWAFARSPRPNNGKKALLVISSAVALAALIDLVLVVAGIGTGLDAVLWPGLLQRLTDGMAVATATCFLLASLCALRLAFDATSIDYPFASMSTLGLVLSSTALVAYALDTEALYGVFLFTAMALHTALAFAILFLGLILVAPGRSWMGLLLSQKEGSRGARRLLPLMLFGPFLLCLIALYATDAGFLSVNFRLSVLAIVMTLIAVTAVLRNASIENTAEDDMQNIVNDLTAALADRSLLLREVYHRVKNNLQQVNAMLTIERGKLTDPEAKASYEAMAGRVHALGMVHQLLIQASNPSDIDIPNFFHRLIKSISAGHGLKSRNISISVEAEDDIVHLDVAMSLGLLVNELVANAIEHAFEGREAGRILVTYGNAGPDAMLLTVRDDGIGLDDENDLGTGSIIVRSLIKQLRGEMRVVTDEGTAISVVFPSTLSEVSRYV